MQFPLFSRQLRCLLLAALTAVTVAAQSNYATPYFFTTFAGVTSIGSSDGVGSAARFYQPGGVASDPDGNVYIADTLNHTIRKLSPGGSVSTLAGLAGVPGSLDGAGSTARFSSPRGIAVDDSGNIFVADSGNAVIRKITPAGVVTTFAGLAGEQGTTDGTGGNARFQNPLGLTMTGDGNLYVADDSGDEFVAYNKVEATESLVRKITPAGVVTTFARGLSLDYYNSYGTSTKMPFQAITSDSDGNVMVASTDSTHQPDSDLIEVEQSILKYTPDGVSSVLFGITGSFSRIPGSAGVSGIVTDLMVDRTGKLLVAEYFKISRYDISATTSVAETVLPSTSTPGLNGNPLALGIQLKLATDRTGNIFIADTTENAVWRLSPNLDNSTLFGMPASEAARSADGVSPSARIAFASGLCTDQVGNLFITDSTDNVIREISPTGVVSTVAGLAGTRGNNNGTGNVARFAAPAGIAIDASGWLYVADAQNYVIRKISPAGEVSNFAGSGDYEGARDGAGTTASFNNLKDVALDTAGNLYVIDGSSIRKILPSGMVSTVAGDYIATGTTDGQGTGARFNDPQGIAVDAQGNVVVADSGNSTIRKISPDGSVTTLAGSATNSGNIDGDVSVARFAFPTDLAFAANGDLFVVDPGNYSVRKIKPNGEVSTVAGLAGIETNADGLGEQARFAAPFQIAVDPNGNLLVSNGTAIAKGLVAGPPAISTQPQGQTLPAGNSAQFSVTASGVPAPTYQWFFNGSAFSGATGSTLSFSNVRSADAGDYTVVVTNSLGSVTSSKATLTVSLAAAPTQMPTGGTGGGGSIEAWFVLALLALSATHGLRIFRTE